VTLHFAYGANMSRAVMRKHAPRARPLGVAVLAGHRFVISADGYASVVPARALTQGVYGVLWRLSAPDRNQLDAWEDVAGGLYRAAMLPVRIGGRRMPALVYLARSGEGRARPGYMDLVLAASREWKLPLRYIAMLERWLPAASGAARDAKIREFRT
jgi:hypothetical protein